MSQSISKGLLWNLGSIPEGVTSFPTRRQTHQTSQIKQMIIFFLIFFLKINSAILGNRNFLISWFFIFVVNFQLISQNINRNFNWIFILNNDVLVIISRLYYLAETDVERNYSSRHQIRSVEPLNTVPVLSIAESEKETRETNLKGYGNMILALFH